MHDSSRDRIVTNPLFRVMRWTLPWLALGVLVYFLWGFYTDFLANRKAIVITTAEEQALGTTSTVDATTTVVAGTSLVVAVDGVKLRVQPTTTSETIASLGKGTLLVALERKGDWYRVKDPNGHTGWCPSSTQFVEVQKR